jgi:hypothetical protein
MITSIFDLIRFIVWRATEARGGLSTLALVKYLYLADVFYAEETGGKTLTELPWIFYHYGPYCTESYRAIDDALTHSIISAKSYQSKYEEGEEYKWYSSVDEHEPQLDVPIHVWASLSKAIATFEDTRDLMSYVYFETAPMQQAKERALLDFSYAKKIKPESPIVMNTLSAKKIKKAQEILHKMREILTKKGAVSYAGPQPVYDESYYKFTETLDDECEAPRLSGKLIFFD